MRDDFVDQILNRRFFFGADLVSAFLERGELFLEKLKDVRLVVGALQLNGTDEPESTLICLRKGIRSVGKGLVKLLQRLMNGIRARHQMGAVGHIPRQEKTADEFCCFHVFSLPDSIVVDYANGLD